MRKPLIFYLFAFGLCRFSSEVQCSAVRIAPQSNLLSLGLGYDSLRLGFRRPPRQKILSTTKFIFIKTPSNRPTNG